jgi:MYXO-CTERM domain-containing protein
MHFNRGRDRRFCGCDLASSPVDHGRRDFMSGMAALGLGALALLRRRLRNVRPGPDADHGYCRPPAATPEGSAPARVACAGR